MAYINGEVRAFFKPFGSNKEIRGAFYELASRTAIRGMWNCHILTLGFEIGETIGDLRFAPIDAFKPIVLALNEPTTDALYFVVIDTHVKNNEKPAMKNYKPFASDEFIVDCGYASRPYWSVTTKRMTFVCGATFANTPNVTLDALCEFIECGEINVLRNSAKTVEEESQKAQKEAQKAQKKADEDRKKNLENWRPRMA